MHFQFYHTNVTWKWLARFQQVRVPFLVFMIRSEVHVSFENLYIKFNYANGLIWYSHLHRINRRLTNETLEGLIYAHKFLSCVILDVASHVDIFLLEFLRAYSKENKTIMFLKLCKYSWIFIWIGMKRFERANSCIGLIKPICLKGVSNPTLFSQCVKGRLWTAKNIIHSQGIIIICPVQAGIT